MDFGKESFVYYLEDTEKLSKIAKALSSQTRLEILQLLLESSMTMGELSQRLYVSLSSVSMHTAILKEADLITITPKPGMHGTQKYCGIKAERIMIELFEREQDSSDLAANVQNIPIGHYSEADVAAPCGLVGQDGYVELEDSGYSFYHPDHTNAQLIWFMTGFLRYNIVNKDLKTPKLLRVDISLEICAEAPGYNNNWPSDIYFKINGQHLSVLRVKGDYGGVRGANNPPWWRDSNTQFGELAQLSITKMGTYLNGKLVSAATIDSLGMTQKHCFSFEIGVSPDSEYPGGLNLFGKGFGNYAQDILVKAVYNSK